MIRPGFFCALAVAMYPALGAAFILRDLIPLVIWLVAVVYALAYKEARRVES